MTVKISVIPKRISKKGNTLHIKGDLTVANASLIKEEMMQAWQKYPRLNLTIDEVERLDLSVLQLILAFRLAAQSSGKQIQLGVNLPEELQQLVRQSGLEKVFNHTL